MPTMHWPCIDLRLGISTGTHIRALDQLLLGGGSSDYSTVIFTNFEHGFFARIVYAKSSILDVEMGSE